MKGQHIALMGKDDAAPDSAVATFANALIDSDLPHISTLVGGFRNVHGKNT
jgi:hypothetical protein